MEVEGLVHSFFQKCSGHPQSSSWAARVQDPTGLTVKMSILSMPCFPFRTFPTLMPIWCISFSSQHCPVHILCSKLDSLLLDLQAFIQAIPTIEKVFHILQLPIPTPSSMKPARQPPVNKRQPGHAILAPLLSRLGKALLSPGSLLFPQV